MHFRKYCFGMKYMLAIVVFCGIMREENTEATKTNINVFLNLLKLDMEGRFCKHSRGKENWNIKRRGETMANAEKNSPLVAKKWYERIPHTYIILLILVAIAAILTWILPAGQFTREAVNGLTRPQVIPGSYVPTEQSGVGPFAMFKAVPQGMVGAASIIFLIMVSTASFGIIRGTGALDNGIGSLLTRVRKAKIPGTVVIFIVTFLFSLLGVVVGPEIQIPFTILGVSIALGMGYDSIVGLGMVMGGGYAGFNFGPINASILGSSHAIMGMPTFSGQGLRWVLWFFATVLVAVVTSLYARKITKNPEKSLVKGIDTSDLKLSESVEGFHVTGRHALVLVVLVGMFVAIIIGAAKFGWYLDEMTAVFLIGGILAGLVYGFKVNKIIELFTAGASSAAGVAMIVGIARAIQVVLENGKIMDTIINALSAPLQNFGPVVGGVFISIITAIIHFVIPSGSGLAYSVMPILGPLGGLIDVSQQTTVLAFQIGATVPNYIFPTVGATMAMLGIAKVPIDRWFRFAIKLTLLTFVLSWIFIVIATQIGY